MQSLPAITSSRGPLRAVRLWLQQYGRVLLLIVAAVLFEAFVARAFVAKPVQIGALAVAGVMTVIAVMRPPLMATIAWLAIALVPVYAAPKMNHVVLHPAICSFWLVALGSAIAIRARQQRITFSAIDIAMVLFILMTLTSVLVGARLRTDFIQAAFVWMGAYLGMRLLFSYTLTPEWLLQRFVLAGLAALPFVLYEVSTGTNPFFNFVYNDEEGQIWATAQDRLGTQRVEAAFGHAIALSMFLASAAVFCVAMAQRRRGRIRWIWLGIAAAFIAGMVPCVSRTGWIVLGVGVVLLAVGPADRLGRRWLVGLVAIVVAGVVALSVIVPNEAVSPAHLTGGANQSSAELRNSNLQRQILLRRALDSGNLTLFGSGKTSKLTAGIQTGNQSIDNAYLALADTWGIAGMTAFILMGLGLIGAILRSRRDGSDSVVAVVALANFVGLLFVALITQQEFYIFALVGAAAAFDSRVGRRRWRR